MKIYKINEDGTAEIIGAPDLGKANMPPNQKLISPARPVNMNIKSQDFGHSAGFQSDKRLPAPPRDNHHYHIVPYYIPAYYGEYQYPAYYPANSQRYRDMLTFYPSNFYGGQNVINREYAYGEFDFTDGTPGIFARQGDFCMSAGSMDDINDFVKVRLGTTRYIKCCNNPKQARMIFADLLNSLYYNRSHLTTLLVKYGFEDHYLIKN